MAGEWRQAVAGDIAAATRNALVGGPFGSNLVSRDYVDDGVPVIRGQNMGSRWVSGEFAFVTEEKAKSLEGNLARPGDIVFTQRGTLGQISLVPQRPFDRYLVSQSQMKLTVNQKIADPLFLYYVFSSADQQAYIRQHAIQTGVPHTNLGILRSTPISLPPLPEQRAIAHILGTLDDKIELNRRMSETLEAIARSLFKSWFVDFDPVRAKAAGRETGLPKEIERLFPDRLVESEIGEVPEGWEVGTLSDAAISVREVLNPFQDPDQTFLHHSIPAFDKGRGPTRELGQAIKSQKFRVPPKVILLSKLNPEIDRVWLVDIDDREGAVCSTEFLALRPNPPVRRSFLYCLCRSFGFRRQLESLVTGTSKSHQRARVPAVLALPVVLPPTDVFEAFEHVVGLLLGRTLATRRETRYLAVLRDTLLPRLISGEMRVTNAAQPIRTRSDARDQIPAVGGRGPQPEGESDNAQSSAFPRSELSQYRR